MMPHESFFNTYKLILGCNMFLSDNNMVETVGKGSILVETRMKGHRRSIRMHNLLHISNLHLNMLPVSKFISKGFKVHFNLLGCEVRSCLLPHWNSICTNWIRMW